MFIQMNELMTVDFPASLVSINTKQFCNCTKLFSVSVSESNPNFSSEDGVLFDKKKTHILHYPFAKSGEYKIPDGVTEIQDGAFFRHAELTSITLPATITRIGLSAFEKCTKLKSVELPQNLEEISCYAFYNCKKLERINLEGVKVIGEGAFGETLISTSNKAALNSPEAPIKSAEKYPKEREYHSF